MSSIAKVDESKKRKPAELFSIHKDRFVRRVEGGNVPNSRQRFYVNSDGDPVEFWEVPVETLTGIITTLKVGPSKNGKYQQLMVGIKRGDDFAILFIPTKSPYFSQFAFRLPNVDMTKEVSLYCWDFIGQKNKKMKGVGIMQDGFKLTNHFWNNVDKCWQGLPELDKPWLELTSLERTAHYDTQRMFLEESIAIAAQRIETPAEKDVKGTEANAGNEFLSMDLNNAKDETPPSI